MSYSIIENLALSNNKLFVLICRDENERSVHRNDIWQKAKENDNGFVKWWLPTAYELRGVLDSRLVLLTLCTYEAALRGQSIDVLLLSYRLRKPYQVLWTIGQNVKTDGIIGTYFPEDYPWLENGELKERNI